MGTSLSSSIGASSSSLSSWRGRLTPCTSPFVSAAGREGIAPGGPLKIDFWRSVEAPVGAAPRAGGLYVPRSLAKISDEPLA